MALPGFDCGPKSTYARLYDLTFGNKGRLPDEVMEIQLCDRFKCLPSQLDNEDVARLLKGVYTANVAAGLSTMEMFLESYGQMQPPAWAMEIYAEAVKAFLGQGPAEPTAVFEE